MKIISVPFGQIGASWFAQVEEKPHPTKPGWIRVVGYRMDGYHRTWGYKTKVDIWPDFKRVPTAKMPDLPPLAEFEALDRQQARKKAELEVAKAAARAIPIGTRVSTIASVWVDGKHQKSQPVEGEVISYDGKYVVVKWPSNCYASRYVVPGHEDYTFHVLPR